MLEKKLVTYCLLVSNSTVGRALELEMKDETHWALMHGTIVHLGNMLYSKDPQSVHMH
jgi:hypothetical protein